MLVLIVPDTHISTRMYKALDMAHKIGLYMSKSVPERTIKLKAATNIKKKQYHLIS
jgi:hypothetical protein